MSEEAMATTIAELNAKPTLDLLAEWAWGVEPDHAGEVETILRKRGVDTSEIARHIDTTLSAAANGGFKMDTRSAALVRPPTITTKFGGTCPLCSGPYSAGDRVYFTADASKGAKCAHPACWDKHNAAAQAVQETVRRASEATRPNIAQELLDKAIGQHLQSEKSLLHTLVEKRMGEAQAIARKMIEDKPPQVIEVRTGAGAVRMQGRQHKDFAKCLSYVAATKQVWLVGPAGSGKTTLAEQIATAMKLPFYFNGAIDTPYKLSGFMDAQGRLVRPQFREAYEKGGVYLFDEVDASMPPAVLAFNAALSGDSADFPDGRVKRHANFHCIAAANTYGLGATDDYVGRIKQDGAFIDRFVQVKIDYDEDLERTLAGEHAEWARYVQGVRRKARAAGLRVIISPRATVFGARMLAAGIDRQEVIAATLRKAMSDDQWRTVSA